jgi:hypothetical protein
MDNYKMNEIDEFIKNKNWKKIINKYSQKDICYLLNFNESMWLTKHLFFDDFCDDANQQFALKLALEIKNHFKDNWDSDWKNDVFLGGLYSILWDYNEQYDCYKRAYDKLQDPPAALLLLLSGCKSAPGVPPITEEESEYYLKKSAEKKITFETALKMRNLYMQKNDKIQADYWDEIYKDLEKKNIHADLIIPDVFNTKQ